MVAVALLGGRGQIARTIQPCLPVQWRVTRFSRTADDSMRPYDALAGDRFDLIINAAGPGDPASHRTLGAEMVRITERFDNLVLDYLDRHPACGYAFISTGAVYGNGYACPGNDESSLAIPVNRMGSEHAYVLAKLAAEAKHRAAAGRNIADLRVFGYMTPLIDMESGFFVAAAARCLRDQRPFVTSGTDFRRDFVAPEDLAGLIAILFEHGMPNGCYDAASAAPTTKFEILEMLSRRFGLNVEMESGHGAPLPAMDRITRASGAYNLGYRPRFTSMAAVERAFAALACTW